MDEFALKEIWALMLDWIALNMYDRVHEVLCVLGETDKGGV